MKEIKENEIGLYFVRHEESVGNRLTNSEAAELEIPNHMFGLTEEGKNRCHLARENLDRVLEGAEIDFTFCSTFIRTDETLKGMGFIGNTVNSLLNERWDGIFHSLPDHILRTRYADHYANKAKIGWYHYCAPEGESGPEVEVRIRLFLEEIRRRKRGKRVLIGAHGNWLLLLNHVAHTLSWRQVDQVKKDGSYPIPNGSLTCFVMDADTGHLRRTVDRSAPWHKGEAVHYA